MSKEAIASVCYFGKVPSRGDFVRSGDQHQLLLWLDHWAGTGIEAMTRNPDWKRLYDQAADMDFAFLGPRSRTVICGHFLPSRDASQRRFPFLSAIRFDVVEPLPFIGTAPLAMSAAWSGLSRQARAAVHSDDAAAALAEMADSRHAVATDAAASQRLLEDFLEGHTIASLQALLAQGGHPDLSLQYMLPALGLLLQPVLTGGNVSIDRALALPLPKDPAYRPLVAAFWLEIVSAFLSRGDFELAVLVRNDDNPTLLVGFNGADAQILHAALDPRDAGDFLIHVQAAEWVADYLPGDYALNRLAGYLERSDTALKTARKLFGETFLGT